MSIQDERDLRAQLAGLLDGVQLRPAPVAGTIQRGRRIRVRRRISAAAGLVVVAALAAVLPGVLTGRPHSAGPLAPQRYSVNVDVLGPISHGGVIAQGVTDGKEWKVIASGSPALPNIQAVGAIGVVTSGTGEAYRDGPINMQLIGDSRYNTLPGSVSAAVTSVVIQLPDGERPTLYPVSWGGYRWVGLVLPAHVPIVRAIVYSGTEELAYSVPFRGTELMTWWRPGQVGPARLTKSLGSGVIDGEPWHATASIGPWGWCYSESGGGGTCSGVVPKPELGDQQVSMLVCSPGNGQAPTVGLAYAASGVTRVVLRFRDGRSASFRPVEVAGTRIFGYAIPAHVRVTSSREYGQHGQLVGSEFGNAVGSDNYPGWSCGG